MQQVCYKLRIIGKVQGVYYRASTKAKAEELDLFGWVKNEPNGDVTAVVEGPLESVEQFMAWCKEGPRMAQVEKVEHHQASLQHFDNFRILR
ncbi:MAG: acylphosphatase [Saprospiraceae bacterium]|nr:acylphosphatase [Saprospiraceae bacterium]